MKRLKERVTDSNRSMMRYTFLSTINFSVDETQEKHHFSNRNRLGPPPPSHPTFQQSSPTINFPAVVDPQLDTFS